MGFLWVSCVSQASLFHNVMFQCRGNCYSSHSTSSSGSSFLLPSSLTFPWVFNQASEVHDLVLVLWLSIRQIFSHSLFSAVSLYDILWQLALVVGKKIASLKKANTTNNLFYKQKNFILKVSNGYPLFN